MQQQRWEQYLCSIWISDSIQILKEKLRKMEAMEIITTLASDFRFDTEAYRVEFSIGDQIVLQNNKKIITDKEVNNRRR